jgi:hypothetical protein
MKCHTDAPQILDTTVQTLSSHGKLETGFCAPVFMAVRTARIQLLPTATTDCLKIVLHFTDCTNNVPCDQCQTEFPIIALQ